MHTMQCQDAPDEEAAVHRVNAEEHIRPTVPLLQQSLNAVVKWVHASAALQRTDRVMEHQQRAPTLVSCTGGRCDAVERSLSVLM
jgi:hypothetical protein